MSKLYQPEAERAIIASLLAEPARIAEVEVKIQPDDFADSQYRSAFGTMITLSREGRRVDVVTLGGHGIRFDAGFLDVLGSVKPDDLANWVELVQEAAFRRRIDLHGSRIRTIAESDKSHADILGELQAFNQSLAEDIHDPRLFSHARATQDYSIELQRRRTMGAGIPWGWADLEDVVQPAIGGDMIVIAARPSIGKTTLAENIADRWGFEAEHPVLFVSIEMRLSHLMDRAVSRMTDIPATRLLRGDVGPSEEQAVEKALETRRDAYNIWYVDDGNATTAGVRSAASKVSLTYGGLRAIIVDYIQILKDYPHEQETPRITKISRALKAIAREFDVPLIAISQLNRQSERDQRRPRLSDIRDSGAVEQDADIVFGLYPAEDDDLELIVLKNRNGGLGTVYLGFDKSRTRVYDLEE